MTTNDRPRPPSALEQDVRERLAALESRDVETLRAASDYLEELAAWKVASAEAGSGADYGEQSEGEPDPDEYPADVPEQANVSVKEIAGTTYHYYQWREGDRIESKTVQR
ncbi:hypothetical protein [Natronorubrum daqingense]|uniref:Uncharacterized protein n=1 Tax=Natronorubrum daqingense TaxID=588898 RepID=A0A1N7FJY3_9EURY|nr:hypothetical protein [Natronorubrum daqingense]APX98482.1 hypothetical protein BB347_16590 [Natronorubrum daqingense]SIS00545.1 hypothetical protein SAMN05421809_3293 [Natronorubrum daqingense]